MNDFSKEELTERLHCTQLWYLEATELMADAELIEFSKKSGPIVARFDRLMESVDGIPPDAIELTRELGSAVGPQRFEDLLRDSLAKVGRTSFPDTTAEFVAMLNVALQSADIRLPNAGARS